MVSGWKHYAPVALLMAGIVAAGALLTVFCGPGRNAANEQKTVVTTVYPLYVAVLNVTAGTDTVTVENLTGTAVGCLHDYQLSPANRITLQNADLLLLNGGGAETFLSDVIAQYPALQTVDTGADVDWIESGHDHDHDHDHEDEDEENGHEDHDEDHAVNEHCWTSPRQYARQVAAVTDALCRADPANAAVYRRNGEAYQEKIAAVQERLQEIGKKLPSDKAITFHESLDYLAQELGLTVPVHLSVGEEDGVSAADLAEAQRQLEADGELLLLYDSQYTVRYPALDGRAKPGHVSALDTAVGGDGKADDWLTAMEHNCRLLEQAAHG